MAAMPNTIDPEAPSYHVSGIPGTFTPTRLILDLDLSYEQWEQVGVTLTLIRDGIEWWLGDWLRYGEQRWGEKYAAAQLETGKAYGTLANYKYVADRIEPSRRRENLSFSHHQTVASLPPKEQDAWLDESEPEAPDQPPRMTRQELRSAIKDEEATIEPWYVQAERVLGVLDAALQAKSWDGVSTAAKLQRALVERLRR